MTITSGCLLKLFRILEAKGRRLIGASDGTGSTIENSKLILTINAGMHEGFILQFRKKVIRGMKDAFLLRHYFCSQCVHLDMPEQLVMTWLGHESSSMLRRYY